MREVLVTGIGISKVGTYFEKGLEDLFIDPALNAMKEAGGKKPEALFVSNMAATRTAKQLNVGSLLAQSIGLGNIPVVRVESAGGSGGAAIAGGCQAITSGNFQTVMVAGVEKATDFTSSIMISTESMATDQELEAYQGATAASLNALLMRYYMQEYNLTRDDMSLWPVAMHEHASKCKHAALPRPTTVKKVAESQLVADPIRQFDCSLIADGAAVVILQAEENAKTTPPAIRIAASKQGNDTIALQKRKDLLSFKATQFAAEKAYEMAHLKPSDIDVVDIHDDYTIMGFYALEDLGFAKKGEAIDLLKNGEINVGGKIPTNLTGGCKARGNPLGATGVYQIAELTMQLRGTGGDTQVPNANVALALSSGSVGSSAIVTILRK